MLKRILSLLIIALVFKGCTRDDICPQGLVTTPLLIITFNNFLDQDARKEVTGLSVVTNDMNAIQVVGRTNTDSIAIPLNTSSNTTQYRFILTQLNEANTLDTLNIDTVQFLYERQNLYVNRACGFSTQFTNLTEQLENDGSNWIQNIVVNLQTVNEQNEAHVTILH
ncbi:DUF6452 family protein [Aequorivita echinoideorum]|uniref:Lipoprotein n=1 Tax=Aequorivita echinoideorum TaxID=1549647 RepID=A0ABS5S6G2_9FLAO|nr:DUF6452 family protein [Aequorivita echinoideorum]MBT0608791.1 hypothetical protein [Aequorivita echinoideorum]